MSSAGTASGEAQEFLYLLGGTPLEEYLAFMEREPIDADRLDAKQLEATWKAADAVRKKLQRREPDWADFPPSSRSPWSTRSWSRASRPTRSSNAPSPRCRSPSRWWSSTGSSCARRRSA
jgi:hypothetical protein